jgi:hypothetical protein
MVRKLTTLLAIAGACTLVVGVTRHVEAQAPDPLVGTWAMNVARSTSSGPLARKRDLHITQKGADLTVAVDEIAADGSPLKWSFTTRGDGQPVPVTGWPVIDTATSTINGRTGKTIYGKAGKTVMESNTTVSADGKSLVITGSRPAPDGKAMTFSTHYDRK